MSDHTPDEHIEWALEQGMRQWDRAEVAEAKLAAIEAVLRDHRTLIHSNGPGLPVEYVRADLLREVLFPTSTR